MGMMICNKRGGCKSSQVRCSNKGKGYVCNYDCYVSIKNCLPLSRSYVIYSKVRLEGEIFYILYRGIL